MQPQNINSQLDSMLKTDQPLKRRRLPMPNLPKPVLIGLAFVLVVFLVIIASSVLSGRKSGSYQPIVNSLARNQEILRVTNTAEQLSLHDPATAATAATVTTTLSSDRALLLSYLSGSKIKVTSLQLAALANAAVDTQMQTASQNNNLDQAYLTYLQQNLTKYQQDLQAAYNAAGPKGKTILKSAIDGETALLANAPLKS
jgi:hypothetical protein